MISFEAIKQQADAHRALLYQEADIERLIAQAPAARSTLRLRLAQALRGFAERLDAASCLPGESCAPSRVGG